MGALQAATFAWRLTVEGAEAVSKAFTDIGKAANKNMKDTATSSNTATAALLGVTKQLSGMEKQAVALDKLRRQLVLIAGVGGLGLIVDRSLDAAVNIKKMSAEAGFAVEPYQELVFALKQFNVEQGDAAAAMRNFSRETAQFVAHNSGPAKEAYETLFGANAQDIAQRGLQNVDKFFLDVLNRIGQRSAEGEKLDLLKGFFGKDAGSHLIEAANEGSRAIEEQIRLARELGLVYSQDMVDGADAAQDKIELLSTILKTKLQKSIVENADSLAHFADVAIDGLPAVLQMFSMMATLVETIVKGIASLSISMANVGNYAMNFGDWYARLSAQPTLENLKAFGKIGEGSYDPMMPWQEDAANSPLKLTVHPKSKGGGGSSGYIPKGSDEQLKKTKALSDAYEKLVFNLQEEIDAIGMSAREQAISNEVRKLGAAATEEQRAAIEQLAGQLYDEKDAWDRINDAAKDAASTIGDGLKDALMHADNLQDGLRGVGLELLDIAYKALIGDSASSGLSSLISGAFSMFGGGGFGGGSDAAIASSFAGGAGVWNTPMASFDVGTDYVPYDMVAKIHKGERIIPAAQNRGDGITVVVEDHAGVNVSASRRSDGSIGIRLSQIEEAVAGINRSIEPRAVQAVQQARMRSTNF